MRVDCDVVEATMPEVVEASHCKLDPSVIHCCHQWGLVSDSNPVHAFNEETALEKSLQFTGLVMGQSLLFITCFLLSRDCDIRTDMF